MKGRGEKFLEWDKQCGNEGKGEGEKWCLGRHRGDDNTRQ